MTENIQTLTPAQKQRGEVVPLVIKDGEHMPITKKRARALAMGKRKP